MAMKLNLNNVYLSIIDTLKNFELLKLKLQYVDFA